MDFVCTYIYLTISAAHAAKVVRWRSELLLFQYLRLTDNCTVILYIALPKNVAFIQNKQNANPTSSSRDLSV